MKNLKFILVVLLSFLFHNVIGQEDIKVQSIKGSVIDASTKEKLAFVNIIINDEGTFGSTSDIDGNFSIATNKNISSLAFSFVGYEKRIIEIKSNDNIIVELQPKTYNLSEVIIDGDNDPANRIIDSVLKYRDTNNPQNLESYYYKIYDNMIFTIDTNATDDNRIIKEMGSNDLLAMETVSEQYFQKPNKSKKNILANKFSGSKNPIFIYLIENIQSIGFYEDLVSIDSKKYVNPISKGSKNKYIFVLESAFKNKENDSIFTISFTPYRNTNFNSLKGTMTVNSDNWAVQNIKVKPAKDNGMFNIEIQQLYEKVDGHWFPKQLNTNIMAYDKEDANPDFPLIGIGKSYISDIELNKDLDKHTFNNIDFNINDNAGNADDIIRYYRYDTLSSERLEATYRFIDSLFREENINLDRFTNALTSLLRSEIPISIFNLDLNSIVDYNIGNGWMLGLGLETNNRLSKVFSIGAFGNYWFKAKEFNYGGDLTFNLLRSKDMKLKIHASHKFERLGNYGFRENESILNPSDYKHFYVAATSLNNNISAEYSTYFNKYLKGFINFKVVEKNIPDSYLFNDQQSVETSPLWRLNQSPAHLSILDLRLRVAFGERFIKSKDGLRVEGDANPVIWISYQKNLKNVFKSPYNFDKIEFLFRGWKDSRYLGKTSLTVQLGYINGFAPITELFNIYGTGENKFDIYCTESFSTMRPDEFFCDRFGALYFSHNFKNFLIDFKKFHPEIILVTNIAWGKCDTNFDTDFDTDSNLDSQILRFLNKGYFESGLVIDKIINTGLAQLGLGVFYRYGSYAYDKTWNNFFFKVSLGFCL